MKRLVVTHLVPPPNNFILRRSFRSRAEEHFNGEVILGEDGMHLEL